MTEKSPFDLYTGDGKTLEQRGVPVPVFEKSADLDNPKHYLADDGLRDAVNVALALGQPLLVTGEPGTGKTQLADSIAHTLGLEKLVFHTTTTATARDLFYRYDALGHFHDARFAKELPQAHAYITYEALGLAILLTLDRATSAPHLPEKLKNRGPVRSVVLIDEIDKAPRDLPNDILHEIEDLAFTVRETGKPFKAEECFRPIVLFTSNSEKNLPDPFLRRCVFYHIAFPSRDRLRRIVEGRLGRTHTFPPDLIDASIEHFEAIRQLALKKRPATAEFLAWLRVLSRLGINPTDRTPDQIKRIQATYAILAKTSDDQQLMIEHLRRG